jgi:O-methyltransferase
MSSQEMVLTKIRDYVLGPLRFMNLVSCFELGIFDVLRKDPEIGLTAEQIAAETRISVDAVEQLLLLLLKEDFIALNETSRQYTLAGLNELTDEDLGRVLPWMDMIKVVCLRQLYYLSDSVRSRSVVGLKELYNFDGNFYEASTQYPELQKSWGGMMDQVTSFIDPWFFAHVDVPNNASILDVAGNTGLGAILAYRHNEQQKPRVTCFDFPEKEPEARRNFDIHRVGEYCSFVGGDIFEGLPQGFDVVMIKHFLDMFDKENVFHILRKAHEAVKKGGQVYVLVPIYPEDIKSSSSVDFFPAYFLGCTMAQGGPQKMSTYAQWMRECGFEVTKTISQDLGSMPPDVIPVHGIICGTKTQT